jgi:VanZ family protein
MGRGKIYNKKDMRAKILVVSKIIFYLYLIVLLSLMVFTIHTEDINVPETLWGLGFDKIVHFLVFFPYPFLLWFAFKKRFEANILRSIYYIIPISGIAIAIIMEFLQSFNPQRNFDIYDITANILAVIVGSLILILYHLFHVWSSRL